MRPLHDASRLHAIKPLFWLPSEDGSSHNVFPMSFRTPTQQWAYALTLNRIDVPSAHSGAILVRVLVHVAVGQVGIGCLSADLTAFVDERFIDAGPSPVSVELVLLNAEETSALVVRNTSTSGESDVQILDVQCYAFVVDADEPRAPGLSMPIATPQWSRYYGSTGDTAFERYRVRMFEKLAVPTILRWVDGLCLRILPEDQLSRAVYVSGTYEPNTLIVLQMLLREGDVFLDVGANAGVVSLAASKWVGPGGCVYGFEPSEREFERLIGNVTLSGAANVNPIRLAVADRVGHARLRVAGARYGGLNTLANQFSYEGVDTSRIESVETTSLDEFVLGRRIGRVSTIKLDIEGAEGAALRGAKRILQEHRPSLVMEVVARALEANGSSVSQVEGLLAEARYSLFAIDDRSARLSPVDTLTRLDEQNVVALPDEREVPVGP